jgi:hypothetical protein
MNEPQDGDVGSAGRPNSGGRANKTGSTLEHTVEDLLIRNGYEKAIFSDWPPTLPAGRRYYARQVSLGYSIYGGKRRMDFAIWGASRFPNGLIIECKWQQSSGSVDEKFPFSVLNIRKSKQDYGVPSVVIIDGGGYKPEALEWLRGEVNELGGLEGVFTLNEFIKAVNNGYLK